MINIGIAIVIGWISFIIGFMLCAVVTMSKLSEETPKVQ